MAEKATVDQGVAQAVLGRELVSMDQAAAGVVMGRQVEARNSVIGIVVANEVKGDNIRALVNLRSPFAFGAGLGLVLGLIRLLRGR